MRAGFSRSMHSPIRAGLAGLILLSSQPGCQTVRSVSTADVAVHGAIERYAAERADRAAAWAVQANRGDDAGYLPYLPMRGHLVAARVPGVRDGLDAAIPTLGMFGDTQVPVSQATSGPATSRPARAAEAFTPPEGYWRQDLWHQMGHEALDLGRREFWRGFQSSFWDLEDALVLTATMGASVAIRGTGVDDTIRNRTHGNRALGDMDETLQILGNPGTHFAAAGVLWVGSTLTKDMKEHEVAKSLTEALAVNGVTTLLLKAATNTRTPDGEHFGWPSGHTSSAFTVAAVLNEYYGPLVGVPSLALAGLVGYQRLDSRVHDFSDVVFGAMLGYVVGSSIARDGKAEFPELFGMKVLPYTDPQTGAAGVALYKQW